MATSPRSPTDTSGLDQFEIGEGISPGGNPELLDALIDLGNESSPHVTMAALIPVAFHAFIKSWRPEATYVAGKFPPFGAAVVSLTGTKNAKRLFALSGGRLTVWRRDSRWKPPHIRASQISI